MKNYATKFEKVCEIPFRFQPPNSITTHLHSFKFITSFPFYSPFFFQLPWLIILFLLKKLVGTNILKIELKIMSRERESPQWSKSTFLKQRKKIMKVDSKLGGQRKEKEKFPCLVANGRRRKRLFFTSSHFPPQATLLKPSFFFLWY